MIDPIQRRQDSEDALDRLRLERQELEVCMLAMAKPLAMAIEREASFAADVERTGACLREAMEAGVSSGELRVQWATAKTTWVEARSEVDRLIRSGKQYGDRLTAIAAEIESWAARRDAAARDCS